MDPNPPPLLVDNRGQRFQLTGTLGRGSLGRIFLANRIHPDGTRQLVTLTLLPAGRRFEPGAAERLASAGALAASVRHPAVAVPLEVTEYGERIALVGEYVAGDLLNGCLRGASRIPRSALLEAVQILASGLAAVWERVGLVHCDVRPSTIRIGHHGSVQLLDFGIARSELESQPYTSPDVVLGSVAYLAPERFTPGSPLESPGDVFSLGCVLFESFTGRRFTGQLGFAELLALANDARAFDSYARHQLSAFPPSEIAQLVAAMTTHAADRRPSATEVAKRCEQLALGWHRRTSLVEWCRSRSWPPPGPAPSGEQVQRPSPATHRPPPSRVAVPRRTETPAAPRRSSLRSRTMLAAGLGVVGVGLATMSVFLLLLGLYHRDREIADLQAGRFGPPEGRSALAARPSAPEPPPREVEAIPEPPPVPAQAAVAERAPTLEPAAPPEPAVEPAPAPPPRPQPPVPVAQPDPPPRPAPPVPTTPVTIRSEPPGATFELRGRRGRWTTPATLELPDAIYTIELVAPVGGANTVERLGVTRLHPGATWIWHIDQRKWTMERRPE